MRLVDIKKKHTALLFKYFIQLLNFYKSQLFCYLLGYLTIIIIIYLTGNGLSPGGNGYLRNLSREGYMRSMQEQLGVLGTNSAFDSRHRETKKNLCRGGRSQDLPDTDL